MSSTPGRKLITSDTPPRRRLNKQEVGCEGGRQFPFCLLFFFFTLKNPVFFHWSRFVPPLPAAAALLSRCQYGSRVGIPPPGVANRWQINHGSRVRLKRAVRKSSSFTFGKKNVFVCSIRREPLTCAPTRTHMHTGTQAAVAAATRLLVRSGCQEQRLFATSDHFFFFVFVLSARSALYIPSLQLIQTGKC